MESSLEIQFVDVALLCWLSMASVGTSCVCAIKRDWPEPKIAWAGGSSSWGGEGAAASKCFPEPIDVRGRGARWWCR